MYAPNLSAILQPGSKCWTSNAAAINTESEPKENQGGSGTEKSTDALFILAPSLGLLTQTKISRFTLLKKRITRRLISSVSSFRDPQDRRLICILHFDN